MDIQIKIGREVDGPLDVVVPSSCCKVGRKHAIIYWHDNTLTIEDNESSNGTFVNGKRIAKKKITEKDSVWLGGLEQDEQCYRLDVPAVRESMRKEEEKHRTDYSKEFEDIKQAYIDYQNEVSSLKINSTKKAQLPRLLASLVPSVIGLLFVIFSKKMELRMIAMSSGAVLSGVVGLLTMTRNSSTKEYTEVVAALQIKYQKRYKCPKCGQKFPLTKHWMQLEADGKCPNPKCNARFVK